MGRHQDNGSRYQHCRTLRTIYIRYSLINPRGISIVNSSIPSKPTLHAKFGLNMLKYDFYVTTCQSGGEGQVNTLTYIGKDRHLNLIGHTGKPMGI